MNDSSITASKVELAWIFIFLFHHRTNNDIYVFTEINK